jgi:hypothetical protein
MIEVRCIKKPATAGMGDRVPWRVLTTTQRNKGYRNLVTTLSVCAQT